MQIEEAQVSAGPPPVDEIAAPKDRSRLARIGASFSAGAGVVAGVAPHVLHHVGPLAGAAFVAGATGALLFGVVGFALTIPMLMRLRQRSGTWAAPGVALALFIVMFTVSTVWIGPAIRGDTASGPGDQPADHSSHHSG